MSKAPIQELDVLEGRICRGLGAFPKRNKMIADLVADGWTQADITRRLNRTRARLGAPLLTPDAIAATINRQLREKPND